MVFDFGYLKVVCLLFVVKIIEISYMGKIIKLSVEKFFDVEWMFNSFLGLNYVWFCRLEGEIFLGFLRD